MKFEPNSFATLFSAGEEQDYLSAAPDLRATPAAPPLQVEPPRARSAAGILQALHAGRLLRLRVGLGALHAPATRLAIHPANVRVPGRINRLLRKGEVDFALDVDFALVWASRPSFTGLRLLPLTSLRSALERLQAKGHGHTFLLRDQHQQWLASGYGVAVGKAFCIVFMRGRNDDMAKCGLILLARHLARWGYSMLETSAAAPMVRGLGFAEISPGAYQEHCSRQHPPAAPAQWQVMREIYTRAASRLLQVSASHQRGDLDAVAQGSTRRALLEALDIEPVSEPGVAAVPAQNDASKAA